MPKELSFVFCIFTLFLAIHASDSVEKASLQGSYCTLESRDSCISGSPSNSQLIEPSDTTDFHSKEVMSALEQLEMKIRKQKLLLDLLRHTRPVQVAPVPLPRPLLFLFFSSMALWLAGQCDHWETQSSFRASKYFQFKLIVFLSWSPSLSPKAH